MRHTDSNNTRLPHPAADGPLSEAGQLTGRSSPPDERPVNLIKWSPEDDALIARRRLEGHSFGEIANEFCVLKNRFVSRSAIAGRIRRCAEGLSEPRRKRDHQADAEAISRMRAAGLSWRECGRRLGISHITARCRVEPGYLDEVRLKARRNSLRFRNRAPVKPSRTQELDHGPYNPVYDPKRDGVLPHADYTSAFLGDPPIGRAEIMRRLG